MRATRAGRPCHKSEGQKVLTFCPLLSVLQEVLLSGLDSRSSREVPSRTIGQDGQFHKTSAKVYSFPTAGRPNVDALAPDWTAGISDHIIAAIVPSVEADSSSQRQ